MCSSCISLYFDLSRHAAEEIFLCIQLLRASYYKWFLKTLTFFLSEIQFKFLHLIVPIVLFTMPRDFFSMYNLVHKKYVNVSIKCSVYF